LDEIHQLFEYCIRFEFFGKQIGDVGVAWNHFDNDFTSLLGSANSAFANVEVTHLFRDRYALRPLNGTIIIIEERNRVVGFRYA
jgi:hypothetical protein